MIYETLIIGSGMAGLACARMLAEAGERPLILDKGRGIGGRLATRRTELGAAKITFDHGAQHLTACSDGFKRFLDAQPTACAPWPDGGAAAHRVGVPGMSALPRAMAEGLDLRQRTEVTALQRDATVWRVVAGAETVRAARVILTVPTPQVGGLLGPDHPLSRRAREARMDPCLTLMTAFAADSPRPFASRALADGPLNWIAQDSTKPGRNTAYTTWVAQAAPDWSTVHLEEDRETIAARMLPLLCAQTGNDPGDALHVSAHRWRYARTAQALGQPFLRSDDASLYLGGDWCLGPQAEHAWQSGTAIARDIIGQHNVG